MDVCANKLLHVCASSRVHMTVYLEWKYTDPDRNAGIGVRANGCVQHDSFAILSESAIWMYV